jgi:hypothetical protein
MAAQRDLISRLADRGEEVLARFSEAPGAKSVLELVNSTRERLDDVQKRVIGLESLERRLDDLDKRVRTMEKRAAPPARRPAARKPPARTPVVGTPPATKPSAANDPEPKPED